MATRKTTAHPSTKASPRPAPKSPGAKPAARKPAAKPATKNAPSKRTATKKLMPAKRGAKGKAC